MCITLILLFSLPHKSAALELPFISDAIAFEVTLKDVEFNDEYAELLNLIKDGIHTQRSENLTLKQYTEPAKVTRFEQDVIRKILRSQGYYRYFVDVIIVRGKETKSPLTDKQGIKKFIYLITPGIQYTVSEVQFRLADEVDIKQLPKLDIYSTKALLAKNVLSSLEQLRSHIHSGYCFYDVKLNYQVIIDHQNAQAQVIYAMEPSKQTTFGTVNIEGLSSVDFQYLKSFIKYEEGQCFQRSKIDTSRLSILRSNLISNVSTSIGDIDQGSVTTTYKVNERNHRTVKAGIGYSSDEGPYLSAGWEHRNILSAGEKLEFNTRFSSIRQKLFGQFYIPSFYKHNKSLTLYSEAINEELDAYNALSLKAGAKIGFKRSESLNYSIGAELKLSDVSDQGDREKFYLASFPLELEWDHTNNILDPTQGFLITTELRPYVGLVNTNLQFYKTLFSISGYHTFDIALKPTLAGRYSVGTITGESVHRIPADERFYVGGGGSVRGYPYQSLSKLSGDDPEGGASFQQVNTEIRIRFLENWGLATFVGGGFAFEEATPNINQELLWAAGLGLRYYTLFAPFRVDLAFPLNKRKDYDDNFQLYISIGQAF